jgi:hypothetical protein
MGGDQLAELDRVLDAGPTAAGWDDQRWALTRIRDLIAARFRVQYTIPRTWYRCAAGAGPASLPVADHDRNAGR